MHLFDLLAIPRHLSPEAPALAVEAMEPVLPVLPVQPGARGARPQPSEDSPARATAVWSYRNLFEQVQRTASLLHDQGVAPGDRVVLYLGNRIEMVLGFLAVLHLGAIALPVNTAYRSRELAHILNDAEPVLVIADRNRWPPLEDSTTPTPVLDATHLLTTHGAASEEAPRPPRHPRGGDDLALLLYTSGTTGASKGARITHANLIAWITSLHAAWAWTAEDRLLLTLPLFHVHGLVVGLLAALAAGARVDLRPRFDADTVLHCFASSEPPNLFFGVPTLYVRLVDELRRRQGNPTSSPSPLAAARLFACGSAPLAPETYAAFLELTGHAILERYGMTETGITLSNLYAGERRPGSVGVPLPGVTVRIADGEDRDVADGEEGDLQVAGVGVCDGYWRDEAKTAASFTPDPRRPGRTWFRTGDLARRDPVTGAIQLLGRRGDLILSGGFNVYPREVEEALTELPGIAEAAVAGLPDRDLGQRVTAWLVLQPEAPVPSMEDLRSRLAGRLARFKIPRQIFVTQKLPRNALGKVQRHRLQAG